MPLVKRSHKIRLANAGCICCLSVSPTPKQLNEDEVDFGSWKLIKVMRNVCQLPVQVSDEQEEEGIGSGAVL